MRHFVCSFRIHVYEIAAEKLRWQVFDGRRPMPSASSMGRLALTFFRPSAPRWRLIRLIAQRGPWWAHVALGRLRPLTVD